jgi:hypothetical protein
VFDINNRTNPVSVAQFNTLGSAFGITASDNYAYLASGEWGLQILRIGPPEVWLSVERISNDVLLSWPATATNFLLRSTASLILPDWQPVPITPQAQGGFYRVTVPATNSAAFFRLMRP